MPYRPSAAGSASILCERWNRMHPRVIPSVNARQNRDEWSHVVGAVQGSSSNILLDQVVGVLRRTLLNTVQSNPGHLCQVVHRKKLQSRIRSALFIFNPANVYVAGLRVGALLMSKRAIKPTLALTGIPVKSTNTPWGGVTAPSQPGSGRGKGRQRWSVPLMRLWRGSRCRH